MTVKFKIPDVDDSPIRTTRHGEYIFQGRGPVEYLDRAYLENFTRLVVHAATEYKLGAAKAPLYWMEMVQPGPPARLEISMPSSDSCKAPEVRLSGLTITLPDFRSIEVASSHFETCITNLHRALQYLKRIKSDRRISLSKNALPPHLWVFQDAVQEKVGNFRHAVQHTEDQILRGEISTGAFMPLATGDDVEEEGVEIRVIDRIEFGEHRILFRDLACWIADLRKCAEALMEAEFASPPTP